MATPPLTKDMRHPRKAHKVDPITTAKGWWYVEPAAISVLAQHQKGGTTFVQLTRKQLERALEIMDRG